MNDPHVSDLRYRLIPASFVELVDGPVIEVETNAFRATLSKSYLILEMRVHFATESEARCVGDPFANGWSIASGLRRGRAEVAFEFEAAEIVDRTPPSDGRGHASASIRLPMPLLEATATSGPIQIQLPRAASSFRASQEVEVLWARHQAYVEGRELLASMAYFCLTYFEALAGGARKKAAEKYKISPNVLDRIGSLTGDRRGDHLTARKVAHARPLEPLSQDDRLWLEAAVKILIWRVGAPPAREDALISIDEVLGNPALTP